MLVGLLAGSQPDASVVLADDAFRNPQAEANARCFFGSDEWFKNVLSYRFRDALAGVSQNHTDPWADAGIPGMALPNANAKPATLSCRVQSIADEVCEYLPQFVSEAHEAGSRL